MSSNQFAADLILRNGSDGALFNKCIFYVSDKQIFQEAGAQAEVTVVYWRALECE